MTDKVWKQVERRVAAAFREVWPRARRNPLSGVVDHQTHGDVTDTPYYIEIKHRARIAVLDHYLEAAAFATKERKVPLLVVHQKANHRLLVILDLKDLIGILRSEKTWKDQSPQWTMKGGWIRRTGPDPFSLSDPFPLPTKIINKRRRTP